MTASKPNIARDLTRSADQLMTILFQHQEQPDSFPVFQSPGGAPLSLGAVRDAVRAMRYAASVLSDLGAAADAKPRDVTLEQHFEDAPSIPGRVADDTAQADRMRGGR